MKIKTTLAASLLAMSILGSESAEKSSPAPSADRVGFPTKYVETYQILRIVSKTNEQKVVTVYGNKEAASITNRAQLPYPYGSVIVMETATAQKDADGKSLTDESGNLRRGTVTGLHVMWREKAFGEGYGESRAGEWEFVEYRPDGSYLTSPQKSGTCAQCHVKAGPGLDFVYRGRLAGEAKSLSR